MRTKITDEPRQHLHTRELEAPTAVGVVYDDNLVPIERLVSGLTVEIPAWPRVVEQDVVKLQWDGIEIDRFTVTDPSMTFPIELLLPADNLQLDGPHQLTYSLKLFSSDEFVDSLPTLVTIDQRRPNLGNIPAALEFPAEIVADGITTDYLSTHGDKVVAKVPGYLAMEANQKVHLIWAQSYLVPVKPLVQTDVDQGYVEIDIPGDIIRAAGEGRQDAHYYLTSRAGFDSDRSIHSLLDVILTVPPSNLKPPRVPLADDGQVDLTEADAGVLIEVVPYQNIYPGDLVAAKWGNASLALYPMPLDGQPAEVPVPRALVLREGSGAIAVSYQILRNDHPYDAPAISVTVDIDAAGPVDPEPSTPENEALRAPTVKGGSGVTPDNELAESDLGQPASVSVPLYENAQVGEIVTVYWGYPTRATTLPTHALTQADIDAGNIPAFSVDPLIVNATPNTPAWPVYYTLSRPQGEGASNPVKSMTQAVDVRMTGPGGVDGLAPATFPDVNDRGWLLRPTVDPDGANIIVAAYENMQIGDVVKLDWLAYKTPGTPAGDEIAETAFSATVPIAPDNLDKDLVFNVPFDTYIHAIEVENPTDLQGSATVNYTVIQGGTLFAAEEATVNIELFQFR